MLMEVLCCHTHRRAIVFLMLATYYRALIARTAPLHVVVVGARRAMGTCLARSSSCSPKSQSHEGRLRDGLPSSRAGGEGELELWAVPLWRRHFRGRLRSSRILHRGRSGGVGIWACASRRRPSGEMGS